MSLPHICNRIAVRINLTITSRIKERIASRYWSRSATFIKHSIGKANPCTGSYNIIICISPSGIELITIVLPSVPVPDNRTIGQLRISKGHPIACTTVKHGIAKRIGITSIDSNRTCCTICGCITQPTSFCQSQTLSSITTCAWCNTTYIGILSQIRSKRIPSAKVSLRVCTIEVRVVSPATRYRR